MSSIMRAGSVILIVRLMTHGAEIYDNPINNAGHVTDQSRYSQCV